MIPRIPQHFLRDPRGPFQVESRIEHFVETRIRRLAEGFLEQPDLDWLGLAISMTVIDGPTNTAGWTQAPDFAMVDGLIGRLKARKLA